MIFLVYQGLGIIFDRPFDIQINIVKIYSDFLLSKQRGYKEFFDKDYEGHKIEVYFYFSYFIHSDCLWCIRRKT